MYKNIGKFSGRMLVVLYLSSMSASQLLSPLVSHYYLILILLGIIFISFALWIGKQIDQKNKQIQTNREINDYASIFNNDFSFLWKMNEFNRIVTVTSGSYSFFGKDNDKLTYDFSFWKERIHPEDVQSCIEYIQTVKLGGTSHHEFRIFDHDGEEKWLEVFGKTLNTDQDEAHEIIGAAVDITQRKKEESVLRHEAFYDTLTGLPNRTLFYEKFQCSIEKKDAGDQLMSILLMDMDRFKVINELHGHMVGDKVLVKVAERLKLDLGEKTFISRESEDEFLILLENVDEIQTKETAEKILESFIKPFMVGQDSFYITPSIGISRYPETAQDIGALIQQAETAMYMVKARGKNNYHIFITDDAALIERKRRIEYGLKEASKKNELSLVYQPKVELKTGKVYGVEALLRWKQPDLGVVSPNEFIPIAEESGMIFEIGYWVIYEAIRQNKEWQDAGIELQVSVNVSALQYEDPFFVEQIHQTLKQFDLDPYYLIIEITESVMQDIKHTSRVIKELHEIGVRIAIDDFGTGYSSLSVLSNVLIDFVKIDKSFIDKILDINNTASLVKTMIQMGENMDFGIVAEGIETEGQAEFLKENCCEFGQGYFYSKPIQAHEIPQRVS